MVLGDGFLSFTCPPPLDVVVWAPPPLALGLIVQSDSNRAQLNTICVLILIYADLIINNIAARVSRININNTLYALIMFTLRVFHFTQLLVEVEVLSLVQFYSTR